MHRDCRRARMHSRTDRCEDAADYRSNFRRRLAAEKSRSGAARRVTGFPVSEVPLAARRNLGNSRVKRKTGEATGRAGTYPRARDHDDVSERVSSVYLARSEVSRWRTFGERIEHDEIGRRGRERFVISSRRISVAEPCFADNASGRSSKTYRADQVTLHAH